MNLRSGSEQILFSTDRVGLSWYVWEDVPEVEWGSVGDIIRVALDDGVEPGVFQAVKEVAPRAGLELAVWYPSSKRGGSSRKNNGTRKDSAHGDNEKGREANKGEG